MQLYFRRLINIVKHGGYKTRKQTAWTVTNIYVIDQGVISSLCHLLNIIGTKIIQVAFNSLKNIFKLGAAEKQVTSTTNGQINPINVNTNQQFKQGQFQF
ncbi:unnamed protein product [Rotaria sordida]|uniref:Uncharacterized protein n=1 Tax=Rotaria sordida TaxID=392033 RepID=A0A819YRB1_9BILA|nr:unnamed protein product [Rotaria sordida]CAF4153255.1 unnamed protein product [Rotaria sordida]